MKLKQLVWTVFVLGFVGMMVPTAVYGLILVGGDSPVQDMGWPKGAVELANLLTRYRWTEGPPFGGGEYRFEYRGDTEAFNEALKLFAEIRAPKLELVVHNGPGRKYAANKDDQARVDWAFTVWHPRSFHRLNSNPKPTLEYIMPGWGKPLPPPQIDVYIDKDGPIDWNKVVVPDGIEVVDDRAAAALMEPEGGGLLVGSVYDVGTGKPIESAVVVLEHYRGEPKPGTSPTAAVDEDGAFRIERIPNGSYHVNVEAEGYASRDIGDFRNQEGVTYKKLVAYLGKIGSVEGVVVDPEGNPAVDAEVRARTVISLDGKPYKLVDDLVITCEKGKFEIAGLPEGYVYVRLKRESGWYNSSGVLCSMGDRSVRVTATRTGTIRCLISDSEGNPVDGETVIELTAKGKPKIGTWGSSGWMPVKGGVFEFENIPADEYLLSTSQILEENEDDPNVKTVVLEPGSVAEVELVASPEGEEQYYRPVSRLTGKEAREVDIVQWVNGKPATLESLRGSVVVLAFWDLDHEASRELITVLNELAESGIEVVTVHRADVDTDALKQYVEDRSIRFRVAVDNPGSFKHKGLSSIRYGVRNYPAVYVIDPDGEVKYQDIPLGAIKSAVETVSDEPSEGATVPRDR